MTPAPSPVLLLGWDGAPRAGEQPLPSLQPLVQALAPQVPLAVVLPRSYSSSLLTPNAQVTTLAQLRVDELATLPADRYPANWQHPMAPYVGSTAPAGEPAPAFAVPAAPYIGSEEAPVPSLALSAPRAASPAASTSPAAATPDTDKSANAHALFPDALETGVEEALDLLAAELPARRPQQNPRKLLSLRS
ncbi:hypothetical protein [Hymenobacter sp. AT01-02]|uniref:hypothetical protein n=1 Tax=Hymenobacter sp. AT01-02 TaxID=1571877 RepID=UPI0005F1CB89|nr:hypothetical protein [Hymenobacter sp. AT01-02]